MDKNCSDWRKKVKCALIMQDMNYRDLAKAVGRKEGYIRQMLCDSYIVIPPTNPTRININKLLNVEED